MFEETVSHNEVLINLDRSTHKYEFGDRSRLQWKKKQNSLVKS